MSDLVAYPLIGLLAAGLIALALVWPQGQGITSPGPFGLHHHPYIVAAKPVISPAALAPTALRGPLPAPAIAATKRAARHHAKAASSQAVAP